MAKRKADAKIVEEVEAVARVILRRGSGLLLPDNLTVRSQTHPQAQTAWATAVEVYEFLTASEVSDAVQAVDP